MRLGEPFSGRLFFGGLGLASLVGPLYGGGKLLARRVGRKKAQAVASLQRLFFEELKAGRARRHFHGAGAALFGVSDYRFVIFPSGMFNFVSQLVLVVCCFPPVGFFSWNLYES